MTATPLPLEGLRVVDLTRYVAGPYCTMQLADAGADVIKVEPVGGEVTRTLEPLINGIVGKPLSGYFLRYNRYKRSICLDLTSTHGKQIFTELLRVSDVLVENYRPDVLSNLGFGEDELGKINPRLIYCSVTGYGHSDGPYRNRPAYHMTAEVLAGAVARTAGQDSPPTPLGLIIGDIFPAALATSGILMALHRRSRTGLGGRVDIAMYDAMISMNELNVGKTALTGAPVVIGGHAHPFYAPWGVFPTRDGHIVLNVSTDRQWQGTCRAIGSVDLLADGRLRLSKGRVTHFDDVIRPVLESWLKCRTREEAVDALVQESVPAAPVRDSGEVLDCPQARARAMVVSIGTHGDSETRVVGNPIKIRPMSGGQPSDDRPRRSPSAGADTRVILRELGFSEAQVERLLSEGVVGTTVDDQQAGASGGITPTTPRGGSLKAPRTEHQH